MVRAICLHALYTLAVITPDVTCLSSSGGGSLNTKKSILIQVCQHKTCTKQHGTNARPLVQIFRDLVPPQLQSPQNSVSIAVETSGCLTQCGNGPNICIQTKTKKGRGILSSTEEKEVLFNKVDSPQTAALVVEEGCGDIVCPPMLVAACDVMGKAHAAAVPEDKEAFLSSVVDVLSSSPELSNSHALASALTMRAEARLALQDSPLQAVQDAQRATDISPTEGNAWRVLAEAHEANKNYEDSVRALRQWGEVQPEFATKARKEVKRLLAL